MENIEIIDGNVYEKKQTDLLVKEKEYILLSITRLQQQLKDIESRILIQTQQKNKIDNKNRIVTELEKLQVTFNPDDSFETLDGLYQKNKPVEPVADPVIPGVI